jgi:hypothetical protein
MSNKYATKILKIGASRSKEIKDNIHFWACFQRIFEF